MDLEYVSNGKPFKVNDALGKVLVARKLARFPAGALQTRELKAEASVEISEVTGKPKRAYNRRDMKAED